MARSRRNELPPSGIYQVTTRGVAKELIYRDDRDRRLFLTLFLDVIQRQRWRCLAFCLMGTHYHFVVETTVGELSEGMHRLNGVYAQRFNRRHRRRGHLFGDRFTAWVVRDDRHLEIRSSTCWTTPSERGSAATRASGRGAVANARQGTLVRSDPRG
jgi:REP element-mobilizing transposase RayT